MAAFLCITPTNLFNKKKCTTSLICVTVAFPNFKLTKSEKTIHVRMA